MIICDEMMPPQYRNEWRAICAEVDDDAVHPRRFLEKVDDFFRRLCEEMELDFDSTFLELMAEVSVELEAKGL